MAVTITRGQVRPNSRDREGLVRETCQALAKLKMGEMVSIDLAQIPGLGRSNFSGAQTHIGYALDRKFASSLDGTILHISRKY